MNRSEIAKQFQGEREDMLRLAAEIFPTLAERLAVRFLHGWAHRDDDDLRADVATWSHGIVAAADVDRLIAEMRRKNLIRRVECKLTRNGKGFARTTNADGSIRPPARCDTSRNRQRLALFHVWQRLPAAERSTVERAGGVDPMATAVVDVRTLTERGDRWRRESTAKREDNVPMPKAKYKHKPERRRKKPDPANVLRMSPEALTRAVFGGVAAEVAKLIERQKNAPGASTGQESSRPT